MRSLLIDQLVVAAPPVPLNRYSQNLKLMKKNSY